MEILIVAMIMTVVVKRGVEDVWHTARGGTPPRYAAASARRKSGAAGRYWGQLWDDTWSDLLTRHNDRRSPTASSRPRGAATVFLSNLWRDGWVAAERSRSSKATRPRPGQQTVPGTVVPNAGDRPEDGDGDGTGTVPQDEAVSVPDEDEDGPQDGPEDEDRQQDEDEQDDKQDDPDSGPDSGPDQDITPPATPTTEGPTTMSITIPSADTEGFEPTINWGETSAQGYRAMIGQVELAISKLRNAEVTDEGIYADLTDVMDMTSGAARAMDNAMTKLAAHRIVAEALHAAPGAGKKEFMLQG